MKNQEEKKQTEIKSIEDILKKKNFQSYLENGLSKKYLLSQDKEILSCVLTANMLKKLKLSLIERFMPGSSGLSLVYSSERHGFSLKTLMSNAASGPATGYFVLAIMEEASTPMEHERIFGALFANRLDYKRISFGNADTTLFRFCTPRNQNTLGDYNSILDLYEANVEQGKFYIMAKKDYLAFGCSNARFGLMMEKNLKYGESHPVETFHNPVLSHREKFFIKQVELWHVRV